ncbi:hypothetical protein C1646_774568 [Rhizophagus diaphanus]|nr:hypothetical protein C1646_774568 [Rhizophagus diaphanus] [Rhizophagus sp. MUCL 43196]
MVRKTRSDKKDTICKRCGHECSTPQKLPIQQAIQASEIKAQAESSSVNISNKEKPHVVIPTPIPELEPEKEALVLGIDYITEEEAKKWISPNACKPRE